MRWGGALEDRARALFSVHQQHFRRYFSFLHQHQTGSAPRLVSLHAQFCNILEAAVIKSNHKASVRPVHRQHSHNAVDVEIHSLVGCISQVMVRDSRRIEGAPTWSRTRLFRRSSWSQRSRRSCT